MKRIYQTPKYPTRFERVRPGFQPTRPKNLSTYFLIALFIFSPWLAQGQPSKTVYAEPQAPVPLVSKEKLKPVAPLPATALQPTQGLPVPQPAPSPAPVQTAAVAPVGGSQGGSQGGSHESWMAAAGIASYDYGYVDYIVSHESGWNLYAQNASGAYGLCQALPASKMASAGADWQTNPVTQLRWCNAYAQGRGGWAASYSFWVANRWW